MAIAGARRAAVGLVRAEPGRELPPRLAGRVLALAALRGLAEPPFLPPPFLPPPFLPPPFLPPLAVSDLSPEPDSVMPLGWSAVPA